MKPKNSRTKILACLVCCAAGAFSASAQQTTPVNYDQVALLKWYTNQVTTYQVGNNPSALVFDGENMWVADSGDDSVIKLRASDGAYLGTFSVVTTTLSPPPPDAMAFDGANIWVHVGDSMVELRASDGKNLGTFSGVGPLTNLTFDGSAMWGTTPDGIGAMRVTDGKQFVSNPSCANSQTAFDGRHVVCVDQGYFLKAFDSSGNLAYQQALTAVPFPGGDQTQTPLVASDGAYAWVAYQNTAAAYSPANGSPQQAYGITQAYTSFFFDGINAWFTTSTSLNLNPLLLAETSLERSGWRPASFNIRCPSATAFDGVHVWVADSCDNTVSKF